MAIPVSIQNLGGGLLDLHAIAVGAGYLGAALGVFMVVPQIVRTFRNRALAGVSALSWALSALASMTWMLYGFRAGEVPQIPGNILLCSGAVVVVLAVPSATSRSVRAAWLAAATLVVVGLGLVVPPAAVGFIAFGFGVVSALPQTVESLTRSRQAASAVSVLGWLLRAAAQVCWLLYALARHDQTVTVSASIILASSLLIVVTELVRRPARVRADGLAADAVCVTG